jgi:carbonic anhydrase
LRYPDSVDVTLVNTGSPGEFATVRADVPAGAARILLRGTRWDLLQFHWHTPSEHEMEGRKTPLEMHLVHSRADGALLVVAVFIERGSANRALGPMLRALPNVPGETRAVANVRLAGLLPDRRESFRYTGSLTTPPFTEPVRFIVLASLVEASRRQIGRFRELFEEGNSREAAAERPRGAERRALPSHTRARCLRSSAWRRSLSATSLRAPPQATRTGAPASLPRVSSLD